MEEFDEVIQEEFINLSRSLEKTNDIFSAPNDQKVSKTQLGLFTFNYYNYLTKSNFHVTQALETAQRYAMTSLAPLFTGAEIPVIENEKNAISDLESLKLDNEKIKSLNRVEGQKNLLIFLDQITTIDPESFLVYQLYARYISRLIAPFWKKHMSAFIKGPKSTFSLVHNYTNLERNEFAYGFGCLNRVIKEESRSKVLNNLSLTSKLIENYLNEMNMIQEKSKDDPSIITNRLPPSVTPYV